jgi:hypothetical protein
MKILVIIANLGMLRAFRTRLGLPTDPEHLEEIEVWDAPVAQGPLHAQVSDQAGRFPAGGDSGLPGGMGYGEAHGRIDEDRRRQIRSLAERIEQLVRGEGVDLWRLAAPSEINPRLVGMLSEPLRERLLLNLHADLTKLPLREVEKRFI